MSEEEKIQKFVEELRKRYQIRKYPDYVERVCNECDKESWLFAGSVGFDYEQFNSECFGILDENLYHRSSFISYINEEGRKWFLVDPTYGQFFENPIFKNYMFENYPEFSIELLDKGYIEVSLDNLLAYIEGFIVTYKKGNTKEIIDKYLEDLVNMKIIRREIVEQNKHNHR